MPYWLRDEAFERWEDYEQRLHDEFQRNGYAKCCSIVAGTDVDPAVVAGYEAALGSARDERLLQEYLTEHPHMLVGELGGHCRWVIPQPRLAGTKTYIPDFLVARINSDGPRWKLIELETPVMESLHTRDGRRRKELDHAVNQINDWRRWLTRNLDKAQLPREAGGLGLTDLYPSAWGIVVIGRENQRTRKDRELLRDLEEQSRIEVWSYDRLAREAKKRHESRQDFRWTSCDECPPAVV